MGKPLFSQNRLAIQTFGRKRVCRGIENSSMGENLFAIQVFWPKMVCRCMGKPLFPQNRLAIQTFGQKKVCRGMGKQLNRRKPVHDWSMRAG